jgi:hypothetical protein
MPPKKAPVQEEPKPEEEIKEVKIETGYGRFEYITGAVYVGNWKSTDGQTVKHGHGKLTLPGLTSGESEGYGYEGEWVDDKIHG